jgi:hypothetical protein
MSVMPVAVGPRGRPSGGWDTDAGALRPQRRRDELHRRSWLLRGDESVCWPAGRPGMASRDFFDLSASPRDRSLARLTGLGSQTGSQCRQTPAHTRRRRAMVSAARSPNGPQPATCTDRADAPESERSGKCSSLDGAAKARPRDVPELPSTANDHRHPHSLNPKETRALNPRATHENTLVMRSLRPTSRGNPNSGYMRDNLAWRASAGRRGRR